MYISKENVLVAEIFVVTHSCPNMYVTFFSSCLISYHKIVELITLQVALGDMAELLHANYNADKLPEGKLRCVYCLFS